MVGMKANRKLELQFLALYAQGEPSKEEWRKMLVKEEPSPTETVSKLAEHLALKHRTWFH